MAGDAPRYILFFRCDGRVRTVVACACFDLVEAECPAALTAERYARSNPPPSPPAPLPGRGDVVRTRCAALPLRCRWLKIRREEWSVFSILALPYYEPRYFCFFIRYFDVCTERQKTTGDEQPR